MQFEEYPQKCADGMKKLAETVLRSKAAEQAISEFELTFRPAVGKRETRESNRKENKSKMNIDPSINTLMAIPCSKGIQMRCQFGKGQ